jgi:hypothetical protein
MTVFNKEGSANPCRKNGTILCENFRKAPENGVFAIKVQSSQKKQAISLQG